MTHLEFAASVNHDVAFFMRRAEAQRIAATRRIHASEAMRFLTEAVAALDQADAELKDIGYQRYAGDSGDGQTAGELREKAEMLLGSLRAELN